MRASRSKRALSLLKAAAAYYSDHGWLETIGTASAYTGLKIKDVCQSLDYKLEFDRGRGYPLSLRIEAARSGFSAHSYLWLGLDEKDPGPYLNSESPINEINRGYSTPIHDKYVFHLMTNPYFDCLPELYGIIDDGSYVHWGDEPSQETVLDALDRHGRVVLKPIEGSKGEGIIMLEGGDEYSVNGTARSESEIAELSDDLDDYMATEYISQHEYAESIYPRATNTIRIFTVIDPRTREASVVRAAHRFGSEKSEPTDNWDRGGHCAPIDVETGEIQPLILLESGLRRSRTDRHPKTNAQVGGIQIPHWDAVCDRVRSLGEFHRRAPFIGWDVVVTEDGPVVIEGNPLPGKELLQLENGIFEDERVRYAFDQYLSR